MSTRAISRSSNGLLSSSGCDWNRAKVPAARAPPACTGEGVLLRIGQECKLQPLLL